MIKLPFYVQTITTILLRFLCRKFSNKFPLDGFGLEKNSGVQISTSYIITPTTSTLLDGPIPPYNIIFLWTVQRQLSLWHCWRKLKFFLSFFCLISVKVFGNKIKNSTTRHLLGNWFYVWTIEVYMYKRQSLFDSMWNCDSLWVDREKDGW